MTRSFALRAVLACAVCGIGCGGGTMVGPGVSTGTGGAQQPPGSGGGNGNGSGGGTGSGGSAPEIDAGTPAGNNDAATADGGDAAVVGGGYTSSAADPGTDGDGSRTLNGPYRAAAEFTRGAGVPAGRVFHFTMGQASPIYPRAPANRNVGVYVPSQYKMGTPAAVMVFQDGTDFYGFDSAIPPVLDNLINKGSIPIMVGVFPGNGGGDRVGSERGLEYDTVSGLYAEWVEKELLPRVQMETMRQMPTQAVTFTKDPEGRGAVGGSSGGAAAFSMAWWHPDLFRRVITFSGTYVQQVPTTSPFPLGCWTYHDKDPYDMATPNGLIFARCESATNPTAGVGNPGACDTPLTQMACEAAAGCQWNTTVNKPVRVWHESGTGDILSNNPPSSHLNWDLANQRMALAFQKRGYHYHYDHAIGAGHVDAGVWRQTLPEALTWVWRGYRATGM